MRSRRTATKSSPRSTQLEKACTQQQRPNAAKNKLIKINLKKKIEWGFWWQGLETHRGRGYKIQRQETCTGIQDRALWTKRVTLGMSLNLAGHQPFPKSKRLYDTRGDKLKCFKGLGWRHRTERVSRDDGDLETTSQAKEAAATQIQITVRSHVAR